MTTLFICGLTVLREYPVWAVGAVLLFIWVEWRDHHG